VFWLRLAGGVLGAALLYVALLLSEKEEESLDRWVDARWRQLRMAERPSSERLLLLLRTSLGMWRDMIDAIFGERLISPQALTVSAFWGLSSLAIMATLSSGELKYLPFGLVYLLAGLAASKTRDVVIFYIVGAASLLTFVVMQPTAGKAALFVGMLVGYAWDILFVVVARRAATMATDAGLVRTCGVAVGVGMLGAAGVLPPRVFPALHLPLSYDASLGGPQATFANLVIFSFWHSNWYSFAIGISVLLLAAVLVLHQLVHPLLATRVVNRIRRTDAKRRGQVLVTAGTSLLLWAVQPAWLKNGLKAALQAAAKALQ
jgi:hypothetical protein